MTVSSQEESEQAREPTLDEKKRDVFALACIEQLPIPEVAQVLGIPLNTAYTRLRSVRIEFQRALEQQGETP